MTITQSYTGTYSHLTHTTGYPKDYPIDEAGKDTGRDQEDAFRPLQRADKSQKDRRKDRGHLQAGELRPHRLGVRE